MLAQKLLKVISPIIESLCSTLRGPIGLCYLLRLTSPLVVIDGGDVSFSVSRTSAVGDAVAAILKRLERPQDTVNRAVFVHECVTTHNKLIAHAERLLFSSGTGFSRVATFSMTSIDSVSAEKTAWEAFYRPAVDALDWTLPFINFSIWSGRELYHFADTDNKLLEIQVLQGAELDALLYEELKERRRASVCWAGMIEVRSRKLRLELVAL
jgi:hypothetical protein